MKNQCHDSHTATATGTTNKAKVLTSLNAGFSLFFVKYWFDKMPWEDNEGYWKRSPLSLVGNVTTPTMMLAGDADYRTSASETEQYYQALKLQGVDSVMIRVLGVLSRYYC